MSTRQRPIRQSALIARHRWIQQIDAVAEEDIWPGQDEAIKHSIEEQKRLMIQETAKIDALRTAAELLMMEGELVEALAGKELRKAVSSAASGLVEVLGPKPKPLGRWAKGKHWSDTYGTYIWNECVIWLRERKGANQASFFNFLLEVNLALDRSQKWVTI